MNKRFTVVTPNYNMADWLEETIVSVLDNMGPEDEYYVIDGGSTDGSVEIIQRYADRLTGWISEPDNGYADALHKGFTRAEGHYLCWINSGDRFLTGALGEAEHFLESTQSDLIHGDDFYIDEDGHVLQLSIGSTGPLAETMIFGGWGPLQDACFWRRTAYEMVGGIDPSLAVAADYDLFLRLSCRTKTSYIASSFSAFRRHEGQQSVSRTDLYRLERNMCRKRELKRTALSPMVLQLKTLYWGLRVRLLLRCRRMWQRRNDMKGFAVSDLIAKSYQQDS